MVFCVSDSDYVAIGAVMVRQCRYESIFRIEPVLLPGQITLADLTERKIIIIETCLGLYVSI